MARGGPRLSLSPARPRRGWPSLAGRLAAVALVVGTAACADAAGTTAERAGAPTSSVTTATTASSSTSAATPTTTSTTTTPVPTTPARPARSVTRQRWTPFAIVGGVTLVHPSSRVERIGFHESGHDGARPMRPASTAATWFTMETRDRGTGPRTAADVVVHPASLLRAPVTGTVKRAGSYTLYCDYQDNYLVIEPDAHPGWEVKLLHIKGLSVRAGDRVIAGVTAVSPQPRRLAFESQVDESTASPAWPHVHIEVVDPSIPDRPTPGGGCR